MAAAPHGTSVVVPTYNRQAQLVRLLTALGAQVGIAGFEVVVADDASSDDTAARARALIDTVPYDLVVVSLAVNSGAGAARNVGWRAARGERIAFIDDDCVPTPEWLARMVEGLAGADIAVGRTRPPEAQLGEIGPFSSYLDIGHDGSFSTCNVAYRRRVLDAVGGFDDTTFTLRWRGRRTPPNAEDTDLGLRSRQAGFGDVFVADALVWHDVRPSDFRAHLRTIASFEALIALVARHPQARGEVLHAGWFLRSVDKAVLCCWAAAGAVALQPRRRRSWAVAAGAGGLYLWQFGRSHYRPRSSREWATSVPLGFVADNWALFVMVRGSWRRRTLLL